MPADGDDSIRGIDSLKWYLPYWSDDPTEAIKIWPSQVWLRERHLCMMDKVKSEIKDLFDGRAAFDAGAMPAEGEHHQRRNGGNMNHKMTLVECEEHRDRHQMTHLCERCLGCTWAWGVTMMHV